MLAMGEGALGFEDLPAEVQCGVLGHLSARELGGVVPLVSQSWRQVGLTDSLWLAQLRLRFPNTPYTSKWGKWKGENEASWRHVFERRCQLEGKWSKQPHIRSLNAHPSLLRALQYDEDVCVTCSDFGQHMGISIWDAKRILADDFVTALPKGSDGDVSGPDESALPYRQSTVPVREVLALQFERERDVLVHSADRQLQIRRLSDPTHVLSDVQAHSNIIWTLQYEENTLVSGSRDHFIHVWDMTTSVRTHVLEGHTRDVRYLRFHGNIVVSAGDDSSVRIWDIRQPEGVVELKTDSANGWACQFDEDKIVCNGNQDAQVWDLRMQEKRQSFTASDSIRFLQYDNNKIVIGCQGNILDVYNLEGERVNTIHVAGRHSGGMTGILNFQYDERWLFAGLHSPTTTNSLYILDFANPLPSPDDPPTPAESDTRAS